MDENSLIHFYKKNCIKLHRLIYKKIFINSCLIFTHLPNKKKNLTLKKYILETIQRNDFFATENNNNNVNQDCNRIPAAIIQTFKKLREQQ